MIKINKINIRFVFLLPFFVAVFFLHLNSSFAEAPSIIKFATLAPEGSTWTNVLRDIDKELQSVSDGRLRLKIYAGGVSGDEKDVIRKMRISQIHCAGFTGVGLGEILPEVRIFDMPFFFKDYDEIDFIRNKFTDMFVKKFDEKGYVFLGWTEVGFIHFFSNVNINTLDDLRSVNMWMWEGDPLVLELFKAINLSPIPLAITDVITSLQTGLIDSIYVSPLAIIALQWFTKVKFMLDVPMADATGAILMTKKQFNKIPPDFQVLLRDTFKAQTTNLLKIIRKDNAESINVLKEAGITTSVLNAESVKELESAVDRVSVSLTGKLYSAELLKDVKDSVMGYRNGKTGGEK